MPSKIKTNKSKVIKKQSESESESDNDSISDEDEYISVSSDKNDKKIKLNKLQNVKTLEDNSEDIEDDNNLSESDSDKESNSEDESEQKKPKEKKVKELFEDLMNELNEIQENIKLIDKDINEYDKNLKIKKKLRYENERKRNIILKKIPKSHNDSIIKTRKEKPKRKGNVNGGFCKDQPVPKILIKFIGLEEGITMKRPQVMSALSNKLISLGLKQGQNTILDKQAVKLLELDSSYIGKIIKFGEFQTFLKGFYPIKENNLVNVL